MKQIKFITMIFLCVILKLEAQDIFTFRDSPLIDVLSSTQGIFPTTSIMPRGGQEKTATGTLRILVIFVRYKDDVENTSIWPDYTILPDWAKNIVDKNPDSNNMFTPNNLSDFFDRCSGGDGSGTLGSFKMIGDVVYVTTSQNRNYYINDRQVFTEILQTLDNQSGTYNINFKLYDNWQFQKNNILYNHNYVPGIGDGIVDFIFFLNRADSRENVAGEKTLASVDFTSNEGIKIDNYSGSRIFNFKLLANKLRVIGGPAHEYCHYIFGGTQTTGHFDGNSYTNFSNQGRLYSFALMCAMNAGWLSAYERYRAGWINPYIVESNTTQRILKDTHVKNDAIIIPLRYAANGWLKEFYLIENYHTKRDYSGANPFLIDERFGQHFITHGLLVYHIEDQNFTLPCASKINILCADGKWSWKLLAGGSTPSNREDDLLGRDQPKRFGNFDERNFITMNVGGITYNNYVCLEPRPDFPGARYNSNDWLGDFEDFFREDYNDVLTKYSNPASYLIDGTPKNVGFEITSYNSSTKEYTLSLQIDASGINSLKPSKPQNLKYNPQYGTELEISWDFNLEPDVESYEVYRYGGKSSAFWRKIITTNLNRYIDKDFEYSNPDFDFIVKYKIRAVDTQNKFSVFSDLIEVPVNSNKKISIPKELEKSYQLFSNYPNPFNPTTKITYSIKEEGLVTLKVYDILGKEVATIVNENKPEGNYEAEFNASELPSGMYIYKIQSGNFSEVKKMLLLK